jgi:hypothetical protein
MYAHCGCTLLWSIQPITLLYPFTSHPYLSTTFKTHPYSLYLHILCFTIFLMLCHSLFLSLFPRVPWSSFTITNMFYIWICIWSCLFLCMYLSFGSILHIWEKTCSLCVSEPEHQCSSQTIHNNQALETTQTTDEWIKKIYNGVLFSHKE